MNEPRGNQFRRGSVIRPKAIGWFIPNRVEVGDHVVKIRETKFSSKNILIERYRPVDGQLRGTPKKRVAQVGSRPQARAEKGRKALAATYQGNSNPKGGTR